MKYLHHLEGVDRRKPIKTIWKFCDELVPADLLNTRTDSDEEQNDYSLSLQSMEHVSEDTI